MLPIVLQAKVELMRHAASIEAPEAPRIELPAILEGLPPMDARSRTKTIRIRLEGARGNEVYTPEEVRIITHLKNHFTIAKSYYYLASMPLWDRVSALGIQWRSNKLKEEAAERRRNELQKYKESINNKDNGKGTRFDTED